MLVSDLAVIRKVLQANGETVWQFAEDMSQMNSEAITDPPISSSPRGVASRGPSPVEDGPGEISQCHDDSEAAILNAAAKKKGKKKAARKKNKNGQPSVKNGRRVHWGQVEEILFSRDVSCDTVPRQGVFPIGLGIEIDRQTLSMDEFMASRRSELLARAQSLCLPIDLSKMQIITDTYEPFETRQYDYRAHGHVNKLFHHLHEDERIHILNPLLSTLDVTKLHNELKHIQSSREKSTLGCSCKHIKVDKLSIGKMKSELSSHGHIIGIHEENIINMNKNDIIKNMKELAKNCPLCIENKCECIQLDLPCSSEICGCLRHGYKPGQQQSCANSNGRVIFSPDIVHSYRLDILSTVNIEFKANADNNTSVISETSVTSGTNAEKSSNNNNNNGGNSHKQSKLNTCTPCKK
eukprot:gene8128-16685_t